ncbi:hypothetical protein PybrP1_012768 [[Pythium] brassicae (nom. inval.)]|nr:hypothetical protein PybrP1_012768 [[Pythium] brassicae (nom. inval.)]
MGCQQSKDGDVVGSTARGGGPANSRRGAAGRRSERVTFRDDVTSDLVQHTYVDDINEYLEFHETIGTGHFGAVKHASSRASGKEWAVKVVRLNNEVDKDALRNEINILKRLHHPQIVRVIASYEDKEHMYMVMQLCKGKELYEHLYKEKREFSEDDIFDGILIFEDAVWKRFSPHAISFIKSLVKENVDARLSAEQALDHKWLADDADGAAGGAGSTRLQDNKRLLLTNMLSFSRCRKMKQTALLSVALGISEDHIQQEMAAEVFHSMDTSKKGSLSRREFCDAMVECGISQPDAADLFSRINQSKTGHINFLEFIAAVMDQRDIGQNTIKEAFGLLDGEKKGRLSIVGLQDVFRNSMVPEDVKEMIASADKTGDGFVEFADFEDMFRQPNSPLAKVDEVSESHEEFSTTDSFIGSESELEKQRRSAGAAPTTPSVNGSVQSEPGATLTPESVVLETPTSEQQLPVAAVASSSFDKHMANAIPSVATPVAATGSTSA